MYIYIYIAKEIHILNNTPSLLSVNSGKVEHWQSQCHPRFSEDPISQSRFLFSSFILFYFCTFQMINTNRTSIPSPKAKNIMLFTFGQQFDPQIEHKINRLRAGQVLTSLSFTLSWQITKMKNNPPIFHRRTVDSPYIYIYIYIYITKCVFWQLITSSSSSDKCLNC